MGYLRKQFKKHSPYRCDRCGACLKPADHITAWQDEDQYNGMIGCRKCNYDICMPCARSMCKQHTATELFHRQAVFQKLMDKHAHGIPPTDMTGWFLDGTPPTTLDPYILVTAQLIRSIRGAVDAEDARKRRDDAMWENEGEDEEDESKEGNDII